MILWGALTIDAQVEWNLHFLSPFLEDRFWITRIISWVESNVCEFLDIIYWKSVRDKVNGLLRSVSYDAVSFLTLWWIFPRWSSPWFYSKMKEKRCLDSCFMEDRYRKYVNLGVVYSSFELMLYYKRNFYKLNIKIYKTSPNINASTKSTIKNI